MESNVEGFKKSNKTTDELCEMVDNLLTDELDNDIILQVYDNWAETYDKDVLFGVRYKYTAPMQAAEEVVNELGDRLDAKICDFACGTGLLGVEITKRGYRNIDGLDGSTNMLAVAKRKHIYKNLVHSILGKERINSIPDDTYDLMVTSGSFHPGHVGPDCFEELIRMTKTGGRIIILLRCYDIEPDVPQLNDFELKLGRLEKQGRWKLIEKRMRPHQEEQSDKFVFILEPLLMK